MTNSDPQVSVLLKFRAMTAPVPISVPGYVLRYLDTYAERGFAPDGTVIYWHPTGRTSLPELHIRSHPSPALPA